MSPNRPSRLIEPAESRVSVPRSLDPSPPTTSETPWRCFEFRAGADIVALDPSPEARLGPAKVPETSNKLSSLVASPEGELYMFGGAPIPQGLFRIELDVHNTVATIRAVQSAGAPPSLRTAPAVWIGNSLMVVWGGFNTSVAGLSDTNIHVFNTRKFLISFYHRS